MGPERYYFFLGLIMFNLIKQVQDTTAAVPKVWNQVLMRAYYTISVETRNLIPISLSQLVHNSFSPLVS